MEQTPIKVKFYLEAIYQDGFQTELSVLLLWGIVPENMISRIAKRLADRVLADSTKLMRRTIKGYSISL